MRTITNNSPPNLENFPLEMQGDLFAMQTMSIEELLEIARVQVSEEQENEHLQLLEKNQNGEITDVEKFKLRDLRLAADQIMLLKAYAWAVLSWRGYSVPKLEDLSEV